MLRFSFLVAVLACALAVAPVLAQPPALGANNPRQAALDQLAKLGAFVHPAGEFPPDPEKKGIKLGVRVLPPSKVTDNDLKLLHQVPEISDIVLEGSLISDAGLQWLPPQLERLQLRSDKFTDRGLETLKRFGRLESLDVASRGVTDQGVKTLAGLKRLRSLNICLPMMTPAGLKEVAEMRQLTHLRIDHFDLPDDAVAQLRKKLPHLKPVAGPAGVGPIGARMPGSIEPTLDVHKWPVLFKVSRQVVTPQDDVIRRLNKERFNAAFDTVEARFKRVMAGTAIPDVSFFDHADGIVDAALELGDFPELTMTLDGAVQLARMAREFAEALFAAQKLSISDVAPVRYHQLTLELRVLKARQGKGKAK